MSGVSIAKPQIIPTRTKQKISHELSFPIGAERISIALAATPQFTKLVLHFNGDRWHNIRFGRYIVLRVGYSSRYAAMTTEFLDASGLPLFNEWQLEVFPVPRVLRHQIQEYILKIALPQIKEWLDQRVDVERQGSDMLSFFYDEKKEEFIPELEDRLQPLRATKHKG